MENWGMKAVEQVFGFKYNDFPSTLHRKDIGPGKPNVCYFMPVRSFEGSPYEFQEQRATLKEESNKRTGVGKRIYADLGQRFEHPC